MHNWPSYRIWRRQERQRRRTRTLLRLADRLPDWNIGSLRELKFHASRRHEQHENMRVRCPVGISVRPAFVTYYDLYFSEDFQALQNGLIAFLQSGVRGQPIIHSPQDELPKLFETWRTSPGGGAWHRIGYVTFERYPRKPNNFKKLLIYLIQVSPTCANLVISAFPSDRFTTCFRDLISKEVEDTTIVHRFGIFRRHWQSTELLPPKIRQNELEELFFEMNREVVVLLRDFIDRGWATRGPLPSIQCLTYEHTPEVNPESREFFEFWRSLSLMRVPSLYYKNDSGISVVPPDWTDKGTFTSPYRVLVETEQYLVEERTRLYASPEIALFHNLEHSLIHPFTPLLALREHLRRAMETTAAFRDRLSPILTSGHGFFDTLWRAVQLMYVPLRLNSLQFTHKRVTDSTVRRFVERAGTSEFRRETQSAEDDGSLTGDLRHEIKLLGQHVHEQLSVLRNAYHDLWNFSIQWILIVLSFIAVLIAVAQFIPKGHGKDSISVLRNAEQPAQPDK